MLVLLLAWGIPAQATWSIVAADPETGQVGGAGTSCVGTLDVAVIFGAEPGVGAVHAQAQLNIAGRDEAVRLLGEGASPPSIVTAITDPGFDALAGRRQYGVVDLDGRAAAWTGGTNGAWAGDRQGTANGGTPDGIVYSAQGNILTGPDVVSRTAAAFEDSQACDLPERLLEALTAGRAEGEGDSRCTPRGVPADSAFVRVVGPDGSSIIDLSVTGTGNADPLDALRAELDAWRADNACPDPPDDSGDTDEPGASDPDEAIGCGCATGGGGHGWWMLALLAGVARRRR